VLATLDQRDLKPHGGKNVVGCLGAGMPVRRKTFRIEENACAGAHEEPSASRAADALREHERDHAFMAELKALRALIEPRAEAISRETLDRCRAQIAEAQIYKHELEMIYAAVRSARDEVAGTDAVVLSGTQIAHVGRELQAVVGCTEQATQSILKAAEDIDQTAGMLSAALRNGHDQGLARDIQERVVQIFEACNFQDLTGQRVAKVMTTLKFVEEHVARLMEIWQNLERVEMVMLDDIPDDPAGDEKYLNGPKLAGDRGHSSQPDVDVMFR
jgi:chemotaxis protein CheZ